jgi:hypothetical protein
MSLEAGDSMYDIRPDRVGWTVYDIEVARPLLLEGIILTGLEHEAADELASLLNRSVYRSGPRRHAVHEASFHAAASSRFAHHHRAPDNHRYP